MLIKYLRGGYSLCLSFGEYSESNRLNHAHSTWFIQEQLKGQCYFRSDEFCILCKCLAYSRILQKMIRQTYDVEWNILLNRKHWLKVTRCKTSYAHDWIDSTFVYFQYCIWLEVTGTGSIFHSEADMSSTSKSTNMMMMIYYYLRKIEKIISIPSKLLQSRTGAARRW